LQSTIVTLVLIIIFLAKQCPSTVADLEGGVRGVHPPKIRKAYVIQVLFVPMKLAYPRRFHLFIYLNSGTRPGMWMVMNLYVRGIDLTSIYNFSIGLWNCSDSMVLFVFHFMVTLFLHYYIYCNNLHRYLLQFSFSFFIYILPLLRLCQLIFPLVTER
jgi:hypothetical protein